MNYYKVLLLVQVGTIFFLRTLHLIDGIRVRTPISNIILKVTRQFTQEKIKLKTINGSNGASTYKQELQTRVC